MGQLLLFFLCNFCSFFSNVGGVLVTNLFSLLFIDRYILAIQEIITMSFCDILFNLQRSSELSQKRWHHGHNKRKWLKHPQCHNSSQKPPFFAVLMFSLYDHPRYFKFKQKYQQCDPCFQTIFPLLMTMQIYSSISC